MACLGISHFGMGVRDLQRSKEFYREVVGLDVVLELDYDEVPEVLSRPNEPARQAVFFRLGPDSDSPVIVMGTIHPDDDSPAIMCDQRGIHHLALRVDDIQALIERLAAVGVKPFWGPLYVHNHPVDLSDPSSSSSDMASMIFRDPDGILVQAEQNFTENIYGYPEHSLPNDAVLTAD